MVFMVQVQLLDECKYSSKSIHLWIKGEPNIFFFILAGELLAKSNINLHINSKGKTEDVLFFCLPSCNIIDKSWHILS